MFHHLGCRKKSSRFANTALTTNPDSTPPPLPDKESGLIFSGMSRKMCILKVKVKGGIDPAEATAPDRGRYPTSMDVFQSAYAGKTPGIPNRVILGKSDFWQNFQELVHTISSLS